MWARAAEVALPKVKNGADRDGFHKAKLGIARFFMERLRPQTRRPAACLQPSWPEAAA